MYGDGSRWSEFNRVDSANIDPTKLLAGMIYGVDATNQGNNSPISSSSNVESSNGTITNYQIGVGASVALIRAVSIEIGIVWDSNGDSSLYLTVGVGIGVGTSLWPVVGSVAADNGSVDSLDDEYGWISNAGWFLGLTHNLKSATPIGVSGITFGGMMLWTDTATKYSIIDPDLFEYMRDGTNWH